jgi:hypothetical protein
MASTKPRPLYPRERPGTHCTGGWMDPRTDLVVCEKSRPHQNSIPGPSSPQPVAILTDIPAPTGGVYSTILKCNKVCTPSATTEFNFIVSNVGN